MEIRPRQGKRMKREARRLELMKRSKKDAMTNDCLNDPEKRLAGRQNAPDLAFLHPDCS
ncbi:hypothetical protein OH491_06660 [Termitidicoccus mucosus]|uniref:hypothetical protein n=1 Tax=Termitidicoccus mucosus TaxID=1184151 RepID=UPI002FEE5708